MTKKQYTNKWIVDFRDTILKSTDSRKERSNNISLLKRVIKESDYIITISNDSLVQAYNVLESDLKELAVSKTTTIYNGFDHEDFNASTLEVKESKSLLNLSYCGNLYGDRRDLSLLFEALSELHEEEKLLKHDINIHYAGSQFHWLVKQANKYNMSDVLTNHSVLTRDESLKLQSNSDAILVATWNESGIDGQGILTGKVFEAIMVKKPVIAIVSGDKADSEIKKLIESYHIGYAFEQVDMLSKESLKKTIIRLKENKATNQPINYNQESYNFFKYEEITKRLNDLICD